MRYIIIFLVSARMLFFKQIAFVNESERFLFLNKFCFLLVFLIFKWEPDYKSKAVGKFNKNFVLIII